MSANQNEGHVEKLSPPLHTPTTIINIFNACLTPSETRRIIVVKGVYDKRGNREYRGYFYDRIRDEASNQSLTLKVPALVRETLQPDKIYTFEGILDRRIQDEGSIELNFVVTSCISEEAPTFSEVLYQQLELQRLKAQNLYKNLDATIKNILYRGEIPRLLVVYGQTGIVDKDIHAALREAVTSFHLKEERVNMTSPQALANLLVHENLKDFDAVGFLRGGGPGLEVFNDSVLARAVASVPIPFFSAIGHAENMTLVEKLADKCFETPTTFGNHLRMLLENTAEELKQSKTAMLEQVRKEYQEEFQKEREQTNKAYNENLARIEKEREQRFKEYEEKLNALVSENKAHTDTVNKYTQRLGGVLEGQLHEVKSRVHLNAFAWVFIVIAILFAFFLGWLM